MNSLRRGDGLGVNKASPLRPQLRGAKSHLEKVSPQACEPLGFVQMKYSDAVATRMVDANGFSRQVICKYTDMQNKPKSLNYIRAICLACLVHSSSVDASALTCSGYLGEIGPKMAQTSNTSTRFIVKSEPEVKTALEKLVENELKSVEQILMSPLLRPPVVRVLVRLRPEKLNYFNGPKFDLDEATIKLNAGPSDELTAVAGHEYGHQVFAYNMGAYARSWANFYSYNYRHAEDVEPLLEPLRATIRPIHHELMERIASGSSSANVQQLSTHRQQLLDQMQTIISSFETVHGRRPRMPADWEISGPYQEVFADLVAVIRSGNPQVVSIHINGSLERSARDFSAKHEAEGWMCSAEHDQLAPVRSVIWQKYALHLVRSPRAGEFLSVVFHVFAQDILERSSVVQQDTDIANFNKRLIRKLDQALESFR